MAGLQGETPTLHNPSHPSSHGELSKATGAEATRDTIAKIALPGALKIFRRLEVNSKVVPGIGNFIGAVAETIGEDRDVAFNLASSISNLAGFLDREPLTKESSGNREDKMAACIAKNSYAPKEK
ncbi:hypothetical protein FS837_004776 [Tulasnella sp. UAMH 9824]|nr:hypothetical protein FS837_004776 [Tulasnella sp. UAMH 9824]